MTSFNDPNLTQEIARAKMDPCYAMKRSELYTDAEKKLKRAERESAKDGRLRFVSAPSSHGFYIVTMKRPTWTDCFYTNGAESGLWKADQSKGYPFEAECAKG
jgi:hypothetical protein